MNIRTSFIDRLKSACPSVSNRVHRIKAPQNTSFPYIATTQSEPGREYVFGGTSTLFRPQMMAVCVAKTYDAAAAVGAEVIAAVEGWSTSDVQAANLISEVEDYEVETELYTVTLTFQIFHK